jgi:hypothetical protein
MNSAIKLKGNTTIKCMQKKDANPINKPALKNSVSASLFL